MNLSTFQHLRFLNKGKNMNPFQNSIKNIWQIKIGSASLKCELEMRWLTLPNSYNTDVLSEAQLEYLASNLPKPKADTGRPSYSNRELLPGILRVLRSGMRWRDLDDKRFASGVTHWRRMRFWQIRFGLRNVLRFVLDKLKVQRRLT